MGYSDNSVYIVTALCVGCTWCGHVEYTSFGEEDAQRKLEAHRAKHEKEIKNATNS